MKNFVVFEISGIAVIDRERWQNWLDGRYDKLHQAYLVNAENADDAKEKVAQLLFDDANRGADGVWNIIHTAFEGLRGLAMCCDDKDVADYLGPVDGPTAIALCGRYTCDEHILFADLNPADQACFAAFAADNLRRLFVDEKAFYLVAIPITKTVI